MILYNQKIESKIDNSDKIRKKKIYNFVLKKYCKYEYC